LFVILVIISDLVDYFFGPYFVGFFNVLSFWHTAWHTPLELGIPETYICGMPKTKNEK